MAVEKIYPISYAYVYSDALLNKYKLSIGDFNKENNPLDEYYKTWIDRAVFDLAEDDISAERLSSNLGQSLICLYAEALMNKTDIANNSTITLLKNKLSLSTKGDAINV
ncbi:MAG: hypothetical protein J6P97_01530 [Bacteroidales bacterium]|nr:hypothetical protein [Bacteroidales bacterium]